MKLNKIDFTKHPDTIPNNDTGNLMLYRLFTLVAETFESNPDNPEQYLKYYKSIIATMDSRGLSINRSDKSIIEKTLTESITIQKITEPFTLYHCPNCGNKLSKVDVESYTCGECHGRLPGYSEHRLLKPIGPFSNWDACMAHMTKPKSEGGGGYDEETAKKVCGSMEQGK